MDKFYLAGLFLFFIGGALLLGPVYGFSAISADRGVSISVAGENSGLIELREEEYDSVEEDNEFETVASIRNNFDDGVTVNYEITTNDALTVQFDDQEGDSIEGQTDIYSETGESISLQCQGDWTEEDPVILNVSTDASSFSGGITIMDAEFEQEINADCSPGNAPPGVGPGRGNDDDDGPGPPEIPPGQQ